MLLTLLAHPGGLSYLTITQWVPTVATKTRFFPEAPQLAPAYASQESVNLFGSLARRVSRRTVTSWTLLCRTLGKRLISSPTTELSVPTRAGGMAVDTKELGDSYSPVLLPGGDAGSTFGPRESRAHPLSSSLRSGSEIFQGSLGHATSHDRPFRPSVCPFQKRCLSKKHTPS